MVIPSSVDPKRHKIIFLNGPPSSGKDTGANYLFKNIKDMRLFKMSHPLKTSLAEFFSLNRFDAERYKDDPNHPVIIDHEGMPWTWRQVQISLSEDWAKKQFGEDVFGRLAVAYLLNSKTTARYTTISDSGFKHEVGPIIKTFGPGNCLLIRLSREGCTFEGDSRSYLELDNFGVTSIDMNNMFPLTPRKLMPVTYEMQIVQAVKQWLGLEEEDAA